VCVVEAEMQKNKYYTTSVAKKIPMAVLTLSDIAIVVKLPNIKIC
jgi:hypothetical protein